jgi:hypothetical protein
MELPELSTHVQESQGRSDLLDGPQLPTDTWAINGTGIFFLGSVFVSYSVKAK